MFQVLYGHIPNGVLEFFNNFSYLVVNSGYWAEMKSGIAVFRFAPLTSFVNGLEKLYKSYQLSGQAGSVEDAERLNAFFKEIIPEAVEHVGRYIRENPSEFIVFED
jgi:hypothetical protein